MRRTFRILFANCTLALFTAIAAQANCVNPTGSGGCFSSIQAAVSAAAPGETVRVDSGTYFETVAITTPGITLLGATAKKVILDPGPPNSGNGIDILANNVMLRKLTIRNGTADGIAVASGVTGTRILKVTVIGAEDDCINIRGSHTVVKNSTLRSCSSQLLQVNADDVTIQKNSLSESNNRCLAGTGTNIGVVNNDMSTCDGGCVDITGGNAQVAKNHMASCSGNGIRTLGDTPSIVKNTLIGIRDAGIEVTCPAPPTTCDSDPARTIFTGGPGSAGCHQFNGDQNNCMQAWTIGFQGPASCFFNANNNSCSGCGPANANNGQCTNTCTDTNVCNGGLVSQNIVSKVTNEECFILSASGTGLLVEQNSGSECEDGGFHIDGTGITLRKNTASGNGTFSTSGNSGFEISGTDHVLEQNTAIGNIGDGFNIDGTGHTLTKNDAEENAGNGFDVEGDKISLTKNTAKENAKVGIAVNSPAQNTTVNKNTALDNRTDFCDEGTGTTTSGNMFGTTGPCFGN
ncbi:MAG: right-handed parallel beta-helix repeat-containing protein [Deltaproteobacteria bacterium]|nr:right-handed parallel beta-helix repeat-containing protein [Deltaproteobacteria bacterium]